MQVAARLAAPVVEVTAARFRGREGEGGRRVRVRGWKEGGKGCGKETNPTRKA